MFRTAKLIIIATVLFIFCFAFGLYLSDHRPFWNDEVYSQVSSVKNISYKNIILGNVSEGNNSPLFYLTQKFLFQVFHYEVPEKAMIVSMSYDNIHDQRVMRLLPIVCMALGVFAVFYFFAKYYSFMAGFYSVLMTISSFMVVSYWAEARPYAMFLFFATMQILYVMRLLNERDENNKNFLWMMLIIIQWLMALTSVFASLHIFIVFLLLWLYGLRNWKKYIFMTFIPILICIYYYWHAPKYNFWFKDTPLDLVSANISKDRFLMILFSVSIISVSWIKTKFFQTKLLFIRSLDKFEKKDLTICILVTGLILLMYSLLLYYFKIKQNPLDQGFQISNRYFIGLTPFGIIAATLFSLYAFKVVENKWLRFAISIILLGFVVFRFQRTMAFNGVTFF